MQRQHKPTDLTLHGQSLANHATPTGPATSPINIDLSSLDGDFGLASLGFTSLPPLPQSPPASPQVYQRDPSRSLLTGFMSRKASEGDQRKNAQRARDVEEDCRPGTSNMSKVYHLRKNPGSTPELSLVRSADSVDQSTSEGNLRYLNSSPVLQIEDDTAKRKERYFRNPLTRSKSVRRDSNTNSRPDEKTISAPQPTFPGTYPQSEMLGADMRLNKSREKEKRAKSTERAAMSEGEDSQTQGKKENKDRDVRSGLKSGSKNVMSKAKSGGGHFFNRLGKIGRRGSSTEKEKEIPDSEYRFTVINLPLIEQTRITRISKRLSECRDKTEFWMPSLPWRCIDYLNSKCENEGLYRVPGSGPHVKHWQRRFDTELDIDLLAEELWDPNEVASMLKAWLRDLPTEIMPATVQHDLAVRLEQENPRFKNVGEPPSQLLRDALSDLSPFNYYLLFAVTCHLSLLLANKETNKMDLNNLAVCVLPCLNLERWLFNYLVGEWRHCWQGCFTEKETLKAEDAYEKGFANAHDNDFTSTLARSMSTAVIDDAQSDNNTAVTDDGAASSGSGSIVSKPASSYGEKDPASRNAGASNTTIDPVNQHRTYVPTGRSRLGTDDGLLGVGASDDNLRRPQTAEHRLHYADNQRAVHRTVPMPSNSVSSSSPSSASARQRATNRHSRSQSELPVTPIIAPVHGFGAPSKQSARS